MEFQQKGRLIVLIMNMPFFHNTQYIISLACDIFSQVAQFKALCFLSFIYYGLSRKVIHILTYLFQFFGLFLFSLYEHIWSWSAWVIYPFWSIQYIYIHLWPSSQPAEWDSTNVYKAFSQSNTITVTYIWIAALCMFDLPCSAVSITWPKSCSRVWFISLGWFYQYTFASHTFSRLFWGNLGKIGDQWCFSSL